MKKKLKDLHDRDKFDYFGAFSQIANLAVQEVDLLIAVIEGFTTADRLENRLVEAHRIETASDDVVRAAIEAANNDFLPPIDREDVVELVIALDQITDNAEKIIKHFFMYDVDTIKTAAMEMCALLREECLTVNDAMQFFREFRKPKKLRARAGRIDQLEDQIDQLYLGAMRSLFANCTDAIDMIKWRSVYGTIEECSDSIEHAVDLMVRIVVKNG